MQEIGKLNWNINELQKKANQIFHHHQKIFPPLGGAWGKKQGMKGEAVGAWAGEMGEQVQLNKRHIGIM